jgi:catechol 2,3-dioxygenase-like lactoylglutathione lyase family enzyme
MALGRIDHIAVHVDDLGKAEEYFTKKLGFRLLRRTVQHGGGAIELVSPAGDFHFDLLQESEKQYQAAMETPPGLPHVYHIAFKVDDINKEVEELKSKGVSFRSAPKVNPATGRTVTTLADSDGRFWFQLSGEKSG